MIINKNEFDQPIGHSIKDWVPREIPGNVILEGDFCTLEPLSADRHAGDLYAAYATAPDSRDWTYLPIGPFTNELEYRNYVEAAAKTSDPKHFAVVSKHSGKATGTISLMRVEPLHGVIEVGYVVFSPLLKQQTVATEAQFLLMAYVFDNLKYRRYEWKCDSLNTPSRKAAERLGFTFEGIFRQAVVYKGRSRDTAWYSITDKEWPMLKQAFQSWLSKSNFDVNQSQIHRLTSIRQSLNC